MIKEEIIGYSEGWFIEKVYVRQHDMRNQRIYCNFLECSLVIHWPKFGDDIFCFEVSIKQKRGDLSLFHHYLFLKVFFYE